MLGLLKEAMCEQRSFGFERGFGRDCSSNEAPDGLRRESRGYGG